MWINTSDLKNSESEERVLFFACISYTLIYWVWQIFSIHLVGTYIEHNIYHKNVLLRNIDAFMKMSMPTTCSLVVLCEKNTQCRKINLNIIKTWAFIRNSVGLSKAGTIVTHCPIAQHTFWQIVFIPSYIQVLLWRRDQKSTLSLGNT